MATGKSPECLGQDLLYEDAGLPESAHTCKGICSSRRHTKKGGDEAEVTLSA